MEDRKKKGYFEHRAPTFVKTSVGKAGREYDLPWALSLSPEQKGTEKNINDGNKRGKQIQEPVAVYDRGECWWRQDTLIGRLLFDSKSIFEDQMDHIVESSKRLGKEEVDLSLLTDGLRAEREQG